MFKFVSDTPEHSKDGDIINIDVTVIKDGFHGDTSKMFCVGEVPDHAKRLIRVTQECLYKGIELVKPGVTLGDIGHVIQTHAEANHYSVVREYCGHGIGSLFHTIPNVPHYAKNKAKGTMKAGHVFTIEPMINLGSQQDVTWDDNWTAVTIDGQRSAQFEHTILVTETGFDILTAREDEPVMLWDAAKNTRL